MIIKLNFNQTSDVCELNELEKYIQLMKQHPDKEANIIGWKKRDVIPSYEYRKKYASDALILADKKELDDEAKKLIDKYTLGSVLPFGKPTMNKSVMQKQLTNYFISELKSENIGFRRNDDEILSKLKGLILLYDAQVERLYNEESNKGNIITPALFYSNYEQRRQIVAENLEAIAHNFIDAGDEFIFGTFTEKQREDILNKVRKRAKSENDLIFDFTNMITNYSTLDELETNPEFPAAINRLVKK